MNLKEYGFMPKVIIEEGKLSQEHFKSYGNLKNEARYSEDKEPICAIKQNCIKRFQGIIRK